uniref:hypothetical protein n=1 Tax=Streptomyces sp. CHD11 TaxID=2741325 RepID=UPI001BFCAEE8|nr:hypothetical protein [Streptomyces sp. CHD11]
MAVESPAIGHRIQRFNYTGAVQKFIVPPGVSKIDARCWGGGGRGWGGGGGGFAAGDIAVQPGETLLVVVDMGGGSGAGGMSGLYSQRLGEPLLIAGGGGEGWNNVAGGAGGGTHGSDGTVVTRDRSWTAARGASGTTGGEGAINRNAGDMAGQGGSTGHRGSSSFRLRAGGKVPIPGMGGGGGGGDTSGGAGWAGGGGGLVIGSRFQCGGAGGSSFVQGPGVTNGRTLPGAGTRSGGKGDPLYHTGIGDANGRGQVVLQWTDSTVTPGGPPDQQLTQGGDKAAYPGVRVTSTIALGPLTVTVTLPPDRHLLWGTQAQADYQLTVEHPDKTRVPFAGALSGDGGSLTFTDVNLQLPGTTLMWVGVSADHDSPIGSTHLTFDVSGKTSPSTRIVVNPALTVSPSGDPVILQRGGEEKYPGVKVGNNGSRNVPLQTISVVLPQAGLRFGGPHGPDHQLTVMTNGDTRVYMGTISADGSTLTFTDVDLAVGTAETVMWVCVSATEDALTGPTNVAFTVGNQASPSTMMTVT